MTSVFRLRGVTQERGGVETLRGVDLDIPAGEVVALVGPSGAGKTSLLRLLNRLDDPVAGSIDFDGAPIASVPVRALRRRVAFVFQTPVMFAGTVADNLAAAVSLGSGVDGGAGATAAPPAPPDAAETLRRAGLDPALAARDAAPLSGGERQRVSIARALMTRPEVLLLDEPTSALDPDVAGHVMNTIAALARDMRLSVVMVTHRLDEARAASTHTVFMAGGKVIESGETQALFAAPRDPRTRDYLVRGD